MTLLSRLPIVAALADLAYVLIDIYLQSEYLDMPSHDLPPHYIPSQYIFEQIGSA
jgi:hypothetical protein